ncbi:MAG TPA: winged helix DNA-binding domain-containing protein [Solirubrobacteraceae bacterium]
MLLERSSTDVVGAVQRLAGMQAQEPKHPFLGLWTRVADFSCDQLLDALRSREVVRATLMRSTLHVMSAADYRALRMALQPSRSVALRVLGARSEGLDLDAVLPAARKLLQGEALPFDKIRAQLQERFPDVNDRALGYAVRTLLALIMVPDEEARWGFPRVASFALADEWLAEPLAEAGGAEALVSRYLGAFGPASAKDVERWSAVSGMKTVLDGMRDGLACFADARGRELFDLPDAPRPAADVDAPVRFLPEFDNLVLAHDDRTRLIADEHRPLMTTKNLRVKATFLVDGAVAGIWTIEVKRQVVTLRLQPFGKLTKRVVKELEAEGDALARFAEPDAKDWVVAVGEPA